MPSNTGEFKQEILKVYNAINKAIFHVGVRQQHVDFAGNKIVILSCNNRIPALKLLDETYSGSTQYMDFLLAQIFKKQLKKELEEKFHMKIIAVFKDYDMKTEYSGTIVYLNRDVESYLNEPSELL